MADFISLIKVQILSRLGRVLGVLGLFAALLAILRIAYQAIASAVDRNTYLPVEELVTVGDHQLRLHCIGNGEPVVILEAGFGNSSYEWSLVQPEVAPSTKVCAYDRYGLGWSDDLGWGEDNNGARHSQEVAETLHALLTNADIEGPYVLVGHSAGGLYIRDFAHLYPEKVAGMVLVESTHENASLRMPPEMVEIASQSDPLRRCKLLAPFGIMRLMNALSPSDSSLSPEVRPAADAARNQTHTCHALQAESTALEEDESKSSSPESLGDIPLVVLIRGIASSEDPSIPPGMLSPELAEHEDEVWQELQLELVSLSSNGTQVIADKSGHNIQFDQPALVVDVIRQMVAETRK